MRVFHRNFGLIWFFLLVLFLFITPSVVSGSLNLSANDTFQYEIIERTEFDDTIHYEKEPIYFRNEIKYSTKIDIYDFDIYDFVTYSIQTDKNFIEHDISLKNGDLDYTKVSGDTKSIDRIEHADISINPEELYLFFNWMEFPDWNYTYYYSASLGLEFRGLNNTPIESTRNTLFDSSSNDILDTITLYINTPYLVDNASKFTKILENQWNAYAYGDIDILSELTWRTYTPWSQFQEELLPNIAYQAIVTENNSQGEASSILFIPTWTGNFWIPDSLEKWNETGWVPRVPTNSEQYAYGENISPIDPLTDQLKTEYKYFAQSSLNRRVEAINGISSVQITSSGVVIGETADKATFELAIECKIEDRNLISYHSSDEITAGEYVQGYLEISYLIEYNKNKGFLSRLEQEYEYIFGNWSFAEYNPALAPLGRSGGTRFNIKTSLIEVSDRIFGFTSEEVVQLGFFLVIGVALFSFLSYILYKNLKDR